VISAGYEYDKEGYSGFEATELDRKLEQKEIRHLLVGGVATDYCVKHTVLDALGRGLDVVVLEDAIKAIKNGEEAIKEMKKKGAKIAKIGDIVA
jgi:nicotinamidase-related amidase